VRRLEQRIREDLAFRYLAAKASQTIERNKNTFFFMALFLSAFYSP
jgi:hypothetical protein